MPETLLLPGDCREVLRTLPDASVDAVVTDPPYELGFMGKAWDAAGIAFDPALWREVLRVIKPGGYLLAFGGTRTYHRMTVAIEDAGFEIRDCLSWQYGSGFPKSLDVSKAIDKIDRSEAALARARAFTAWMRSTGITARQIDDATGTHMGKHYTTHPTQPAVATADLFDLLRPLLPFVPADIEELVRSRTVESENMKRRAVVGSKAGIDGSGFGNVGHGLKSTVINVTKPHTDDARRWEGWGTALKPAWEPIVVARAPFPGTVAANVLKHGTGAMNIDACRVATTDDVTTHSRGAGYDGPAFGHMNPLPARKQPGQEAGRWPANVILTHAPGCERAGTQKVKATSGIRPADVGTDYGKQHKSGSMAGAKGVTLGATYADADGTETVAAYDCAPGCPVAALDAQSGQSTSTGGRTVKRSGGGNVGSGKASEASWTNEDPGFGDVGGASRFFNNLPIEADDLTPFLYAPKASRSEREAGCDALPARSGAAAVDRAEGSAGLTPRAGAGRSATEVRNPHPTVKPIAVMRHLVRLVTPPGGVVLDPFMGSGTTGIAAVREGVNFVGIEREAEYRAIAEARIAHATPDKAKP